MKSIGEETLAGPGIDIDCFVLENLFSLEIKINTINVSKVPRKHTKQSNLLWFVPFPLTSLDVLSLFNFNF